MKRVWKLHFPASLVGKEKIIDSLAHRLGVRGENGEKTCFGEKKISLSQPTDTQSATKSLDEGNEVKFIHYQHAALTILYKKFYCSGARMLMIRDAK